MANNKLHSLSLSFVARSASTTGPFSSYKWNSCIEEIASDLSVISDEWNKHLVNLLSSLPDGTDDTSVDAFTFGLDGKNFYVDQAATTASTFFFNSLKDRPDTLYEALLGLYTYIDNQIALLPDSPTSSAGLSTDEINAIGAHIFNSSATSSASSLDGKSENNRLNIIQVAQDLYGEGSYTLDNDGVKNLDTYSLKDMVAALLTLHHGTWNSNIALDHAGLFTGVAQTAILQTPIQDDEYAGTPSNLTNDLDQIRTTIKNLKGTAGWMDSLPPLYVVPPEFGEWSVSDLTALFTLAKGTGSKHMGNPWGYALADIDDLPEAFTALRTFTGQADVTDTTPSYTSTVYVDNGDSLQAAIGKLDLAISEVTPNLTSTLQTTDDTPSPLWEMVLADQKAYWLEANVVARESTGADRVVQKVLVQAHREGAGAVVGDTLLEYLDPSTSTWVVEWASSGNNVQLQVTGPSTLTVNWAATIKYQSV